MTGVVVAVSAVVGACVGSFVGLVVDRVPAGGSVLSPPSRCPACARRLGPLDLVPIFSWLSSRGRCRTCGAEISARSTAIEAALAALFAIAVEVLPHAVHLAIVLPALAVLVAVTAIDLEHRRIPNAITYPAIIVALVGVTLAGALGADLDLVGAFTGGASFGGVLFLVAMVSRGGMGLGDVKFAVFIGIVVGALDLGSVGVAAGVAILLGGIAAIAALALGADRRAALPFGPMLAAGAAVALLAGRSLLEAYLGLFR